MENSVNAIDNYYLLEFTNLQTRVSEAKIVYTLSVNYRYVELYFDVNTTGLFNFTMQERSFYRYNIYEQTSSTNTDINDASVLGLRETGKAWVGGTSEVTYVKQEEADKTNDVYLKV
jgi:hypothetical protein|tara:strand:- start:217 stop:567 length:351 start_codon:yes stop_codon:yes gene_type:complete